MRVDAAIVNLERIVGERAFTKGAAAYREGKARHAPAVFGVYSGRWIAGYDDAATSSGRKDDQDLTSA